MLKENGAKKKREPESDEENDSSDDVKSVPAKKCRIQDEEPEVESASEAGMVENGELPEPKVEEVDDGGHHRLHTTTLFKISNYEFLDDT